ncbi:MAG: cytochrome c oxidase assembly protein [Pararhizobium sp.]
MSLLASSAPGPAGSFCGTVLFGWTADLSVTAPLLLTAGLYGIGVARLWRRAGAGRGARFDQVACFSAGWLVLAAALVSPLHEASERVFTAHMIEHELIMAVAAPLLAVSRPLAPMLWSLPAAARREIGAWPKARWFRALWHGLTTPVVATLLHGLAIWLWHAPPLFKAALASEPVHWLQHFCFLFSALLFWWTLFFSRASRRSFGPAIGHLFATAGHTGLLGLLLVLSPHVWFPGQGIGAAAWGLTAMEDQQLAGLVMWIPASLIYAGAAIALAGAWIASSSRGKERFDVLRPS